MRDPKGMNWSQRIRRGSMILVICGIGLVEGYFLPRYGIEWMLAAMAATAFLGGYWTRTSWD